jgi:hypothetical protein
MLIFRDNSGGYYFNSIFTEYQAASGGAGITVEDIDNTGEQSEDSRKRLEAGELVLASNIWWAFGAGATLAEIAPQVFVRDHLTANGNAVVDPQLRGIDRGDALGIPFGELDPRPAQGSPALSGAMVVDDAYFTPVNYRGAFGGANWLEGWTALSGQGFLSTAVEELIEGGELPTRVALDQNYPNPFNPSTSIEFKLEQTQQVRLAVYDLLGREVSVLIDGVRGAGTYRAQFEAGSLASGLYFYRLETVSATLSRTMMLLK